MEFRVLGPVEIRVDGHPIPSGGPKQRALLAFLLLNANNVVPVDVLVDEVWGDNPPASARHSLEAYVSRLRRLFADHGPSLVRRGSGYSIDLGDALLDEHVFAQLVDDAA